MSKSFTFTWRCFVHEALLVVDVDSRNYWDDPDWCERNGRVGGIESIQKIIQAERAKNGVIVFVVYDEKRFEPHPYQIHASQECAGCGAFESRLADFLEHRHSDRFEPVFVKKQNNAFSNPILPWYLHLCGVEKIRIIGCNMYQCLRETAIGAVRSGFHVTLVEAGAFPRFKDRLDRQWWRDTVYYFDSSKGAAGVSVTIE